MITDLATEKQKAVLKKFSIDTPENLTRGQASNLINTYLAQHNNAILPATNTQIEILNAADITATNNLTKSQANKLIAGELKKLQADVNFLSDAKKTAILDKLLEEYPEISTIANAMTLPATEKQISILKKAKIKIQKDLTKAQAATIISDYVQKLEAEAMSQPATKKQVEALKKAKIDIPENISKGQASKLLATKLEQWKAEANLPATEKQLEALNKAEIDYTEKLTKGQASLLIGRHIKALENEILKPLSPEEMELHENTKIDDSRIRELIKFESVKNCKITANTYRTLAQKSFCNSQKINDKEIATTLIKEGHQKYKIVDALNRFSPFVNETVNYGLTVLKEIKIADIQKQPKLAK